MSVASFGFHSASLIPSEEELEQRSLLSSNARASLGGIGSVVAISAIAATAISCPLLVPVILAGAAVTLTLTGVVGDQLWRYRKICQNAGIIFNSTSSIRPLSVEGSSQIIATEHSSETEEWRERLIAVLF
jgi:hypothetical protein